MITHLDHSWMPRTHGWRESSDWSIISLWAALCALQGSPVHPDIVITKKIDDGVSLKIRKVRGVVSVGYKGPTAPYVHPDEDLESHSYYSNKEYLDKLKVVLLHADEILSHEDDAEFQIGYIHHSDNSISGSVQPNVIEYDLEVEGNPKLAIVQVHKDSIDCFGNRAGSDGVLDLRSTMNVHLMSTKVNRIHIEYSDYQHINDLLSYAWMTRMEMIGSGTWDVFKFNKNTASFLNSWFRIHDESPICSDYIDYLESKGLKEEADYIDPFYDHYDQAFMLVYLIWSATQMISKLDPTEKEGYVVSCPGGYTFKIVDADFTRKNHLKWN